MVNRLPEAIKSGAPYPVEALFLYYTQPRILAFRVPEDAGSAGTRPVHRQLLPLHGRRAHTGADLILPDHTFLERWQDDPTPRNLPFPVLGIRQPVRPPLYDTQATSDVILRLADALGDPVRAALPWKDTKTFLKERVQGVYDAGGGTIGTTPEWPSNGSASTEEEDSSPPASYGEFWSRLLERGALVESGIQVPRLEAHTADAVGTVRVLLAESPGRDGCCFETYWGFRSCIAEARSPG